MGLGKIFGGTETTTSEQKSSVNVPSWYKEAEKGAFDLMGEISDRPYEAYTGERIAGFTPDQLAAQQGVRGTYQTGQASLGQAMELARMQGDRAMRGGPTQAELQGLMSPYQQGVTDISIRKATEEADRQREMLGARAASMDAFGGGRSDLALARIGQGAQETIGDIQARGSQEAYQQAMGQWNIGQQQLGQAAQTGLGAASGALGTSLQGLAALSGSGTQQQMQEQAMREQEYADYREAKDYDLQRYGLKQQGLSDIDTSLWDRTTTSSQSKPSGGWLSKAMGAGMMLANPMSAAMGAASGGGMQAFLGGFGDNAKKDGGYIKPQGKYACGGKVNKYADGGIVSKFQSMLGMIDDTDALRPSDTDEEPIHGLPQGISDEELGITPDMSNFKNPKGWDLVPTNGIVEGEDELPEPTSMKLQGLQERMGLRKAGPKFTTTPDRYKETEEGEPTKEESKKSKFKSWLEDPMTQFGARLLSSDKEFFGALGEAAQAPHPDSLKAMQAEKIRRELDDPKYREYALKKAGRGAEKTITEEQKREDKMRTKASDNMLKELEAMALQNPDFASTPELEQQLFNKHFNLLKGSQTTSAPSGPAAWKKAQTQG